ncbi:hypothetical protein ABT039_22555 [Streptomyces lasiicapitis]|uniref:hypothetical protein n=1 Tax=Streptomyces lasiicapitis TaxID=1923961 RepID=UPI00331C6AE9
MHRIVGLRPAPVPGPREPVPDAGAADELQAEVTVLTELLEEASRQLEASTRAARQARKENEALAEQLRDAVAAGDAEIGDHLLTLGQLEQARSEADTLRTLLLRQGRSEEIATAAGEPSVLPTSFAELWERLDAFAYVRVTADRRIALALDEHAEARTWAAKAWHGLAALDAYAAHSKQGFAGGFYQFCKHAPAGARGYPVSQVAMTETAATMAAHGRERLFPDLAGERREMQPHLKLAARGNLCPRLHFLDDLAGNGASGLVIVGYVGPHLTNRKTS